MRIDASEQSFAEAGFERYSKRTRRERFLQERDQVVPWEALVALIEPCYPSKRQGAGRPAVGLDRMLRIHFLQHWFSLSDPAVEEALYDSKAMRRFGSIGDVVELVELLCMAIVSTSREGGKAEGKCRIRLEELLGATIRTRCEDEIRCLCLRVCRTAREGISFVVLVAQE